MYIILEGKKNEVAVDKDESCKNTQWVRRRMKHIINAIGLYHSYIHSAVVLELFRLHL